jgi:hypothetical protein
MMKKIVLFVCFGFQIISLLAQVPDFKWAKQIGGSAINFGFSLTIDGNGNIITTGEFKGTTDFDPGPAIYNLSANNADIFISKLDSSGAFTWAKKIGGPYNEVANSVAIDTFGNIYTTGYFESTTDFDPGPAVYNLNPISNLQDVFVLKLDKLGNFVWAKQMGGAGAGTGDYISLDNSGNIFISGHFSGTSDFDPGIATFSLTSSGGDDLFNTKLDSAGNFIWAKKMGGPKTERIYSTAVDKYGNLLSIGIFQDTADFDPGPAIVNIISKGAYDIFILKLDPNGDFVFAKSIGGSEADYAYSIALDTTGNIYSTGSYKNTVDFDPGPGVHNLAALINTTSDIFILKLDSSGNFKWAKKLGGMHIDYGLSITIDLNENVYTTGLFDDISDFDPGPGTYKLTSSGNNDIFFSKLDSSGNFAWAKKMGGSIDNASVTCIKIDSWGNLYTAGYFQSGFDFDPGIGACNLVPLGPSDLFIHKMTPCTIDVSTSINGSEISAVQSGASYQWINCNNGLPISGETNQVFSPITNGNYAVIITYGNCSYQSSCVDILNVAISENRSLGNLSIYPNPTNGFFTIELPEKAQVKITNTLGEIVFEAPFEAGKQTIDLGAQPDGMYFVQVHSNESVVATQKIIKQ